MAKGEILLWVAGLIMMIVIGLAVAPIITKSMDSAKNSVVVNEINNIRMAIPLWQVDNALKSICDIQNIELASYVKLEQDSSNKIISKSNSNIKYSVSCSANSKLRINVDGMTSDIKTKVFENIKSNTTSATITNPINFSNNNNGQLELEFEN